MSMRMTFCHILLCVACDWGAQGWADLGSVPPDQSGDGALYFTSETTGYYMGTTASFKTSDGGLNWNNLIGTPGAFVNVCFPTANVGYLLSTFPSTHVYKSPPSGSSIWYNTYVTNPQSSDIFFVSVDTGYVVGQSGSIFKTTNGNSTWTSQASGSVQWLRSIRCISSNRCVVVGDSGVLFMTTNGGNIWTRQNSGTTIALRGLSCPSTTICYAVGGNMFIKTTDGGISWIIGSLPANIVSANSTFFTSVNTGYVVGGSSSSSSSGGVVLKTTDGGQRWNLDYSYSHVLNHIQCPDSNVCYAGGTSGSLVKYVVPSTGILYLPPESKLETWNRASWYSLSRPAHVRISLLDVRGRETAVLANGTEMAGRHFLNWHGRDIPRGFYFIDFEMDASHTTLPLSPILNW